MLKSMLDAVMERRARQLMDHVGAWLPPKGRVLDLGSGTGHLSARLERELGLEMVTADVTLTALPTASKSSGVKIGRVTNDRSPPSNTGTPFAPATLSPNPPFASGRKPDTCVASPTLP